MAELASRDRLQPSLLDRLIDPDPRQTNEPVNARVLTRQQLRQAVLRDLSWLFNATRPEPELGSERRAERQLWQVNELARRSVLNFGMPAFSGQTLSSVDIPTIRRAVAECIKTFEPRIDPLTLEVDVKVDHDNHHNTMQMTIRGFMWNQPVPLELLLAADVDFETGTTRLRDVRA